LILDGNTCQAIRIGLTNVSPIPRRAANAEAALTGKPLTEDNIKAAGTAAAQECEPSADLRGPEDYKRDIVRVLTARAIHKAMERARG
jgi:carbon-monoxide dehydrogenase medium subunit